MKRCPNCNRVYTNDAQKFCTQDGIALVDAQIPGAGQGETMRIDSSQLNSQPLDDEVTKVISRPLSPPAEDTGEFDPYRTIIAQPHETTSELPRNTQDLPPAEPQQVISPPPPPVSGPIGQAPPQASAGSTTPSAPLPTIAFSPGSGPINVSGPITPSAQLPQPAVAPPVVPPTAPKKKSKLPLVLGILVVLLFLGIGVAGAAYWFVVRPMLEARRVVINEPGPPLRQPTPIVENTPNDKGDTKPVVKEIAPYSPPSNAVQFVNSNAKLDGKLKEHYVDFSFYYPESWQKDPKAGVPGASNFAKVERRLPPDYTQENFAVGWYSSSGSSEGDKALYHKLVENLSAQFAKSFGEYQKISEGPTKAGPYEGYGFRFESISRNTEKGDIKIWGRVILLPPVDGSQNGVTLLMLATSLAPELNGVNDVGVKGQLPMMLESFRFGKQ